jgi:hypothetical protein
MIDSAVNKLLHAPTTKLKARAAEGEDASEMAASLRYLFDLQEIALEKKPAEAGEPASTGDDDERLPH